MAGDQLVVIYPPASDGGRRVRVGTKFVGMAYGLLDVVEFLRLAGLEEADEDWVRRPERVEWRGGGPGRWVP
ncbi:hypothetical protein HCJ93_10475 [Streptomyces sp. SBST2-5]|uniref:Uncharacterized protein n=1 Tax=Streptomyces composti TaxID=2720025 RepID=A0ABX1A667_9ACTN|nr:hypothetical protein [Streptomyces composti]NJP50482.1 hypothetical protein [Streptomyces composti]